jgi:hypothetical protein
MSAFNLINPYEIHAEKCSLPLHFLRICLYIRFANQRRTAVNIKWRLGAATSSVKPEAITWHLLGERIKAISQKKQRDSGLHVKAIIL